MREPPGAASGDAPAFETVERLRGRLGDYLSGAAGRTVSVERVIEISCRLLLDHLRGLALGLSQTRTKPSFASARLTGCSRPIAQCRNSNR